MLNSNRPSNPTTLGRILAGERPAPAGTPTGPVKPSGIPMLELPLGQSIILTCLFIFMMLICFSMGVLVGKQSAPQPVATSSTALEKDANTLPPSSRNDASREQATEDPLTKSPRTVSMPSSKNKVNTFPSSGLPIPPSDLAKATPPKPRATEYPAPGKPVSSTVPGAALPSSSPPASTGGAAPAAPSHDAASQVAANASPSAPAAPAIKPISPVPAVETAEPQKTPVTTATPPEALTNNEKKTEDTVIPLPEKTSDSVADGKDAAKKETLPDKNNETKETPPAKGTYCIQVASFSGENRRAVAEEYKKRLESNSELRADLVTSEDGRYVKVYVGSYPNKDTAVKECEKLRKRGGFTGAFVKIR